MKIFLDSSRLESIISCKETGLIDGITTNPSLLSQEITKTNHPNISKLLDQICAVMHPFPVSIEVTEKDPAEIYAQAKKISVIAQNAVVKIPCYREYLPVIRKLVQDKININITLLFSLPQALAMAKLGVRYVSPFIGRLDDIDSDGIELIENIRIMFDNYGYETEILAASMRNTKHIHDVLLAGSDIATLPVELFEKLVDHPLTTIGMAKFEQDWKKTGLIQFP